MNKKSMVMVGAFPPPVVGLAVVNQAVRNELRASGCEPWVIDLAAPSLNRSILVQLGRVPRVLAGLGRLAITSGLRGCALYMSISGGKGQLYEILFLLLARLRGMRIFLHHHSFAYLDIPSQLTRWLIRLAGCEAMHITQSANMSERLQNIYGVRHTIPISNSVFFVAPDVSVNVRRNPKTIGFLSNISSEKGVFEFLDLCAAMQKRGLPLRAQLAGPFHDKGIEPAVRKRLNELVNIEYLGPKYGAEKEAFLNGLDILVFPTHYDNETEGIVNHEAMSRGIPVIAYGRGCIPEIVGRDCGKVIDPADSFVPHAMAQIQCWLNDPVAFEQASRTATRRFAETRSRSKKRWQALLIDLTAGSDTR